MQFILNLTKVDGGSLLPLSYQYALSTEVQRILGNADPVSSQFLHKRVHDNHFEKKCFNRFTFSMLQFDAYQIHPKDQRIEHTGHKVALDIRFSIDQEAAHFIKRLFLDQWISLGDQLSRVEYQVTHIETVAPIKFKDVMKLRCLSPLFIPAMLADGREEYLSPKDERFPKNLKEDLLRKLLSKQPKIPGSKELDHPSPEIHFQLLNEPRKKGITIKDFTHKPIKIISYQFDFKLKASPILQELGYYGGFGSRNALGFGCVGVLS